MGSCQGSAVPAYISVGTPEAANPPPRQLERAIAGVSRRMLTLNLRSLERNGLITRTVHPTAPPSVEYAITPLAAQIRDPLEALADWARHAAPDLLAARRAYDDRG
ncbi:winged helix-turn-helix transcriptional regulator [Actinomadura rudentiformis]|uniref:Helix-turn-helix transcriptional regulator n=1 Tax=Actinomadura rudentiformis TaxID=359158 RepID=A0A6H9YRK2_9ACTN|nr:helix-turn-helix domain-containing protein [Actinomadura rudentiformis]KAB2350338.1 helix-turn-helix transcriptional regulator [Actinomadura rudentiformis]